MVDRNHSDLTNIIATGLADNTSGAITAQILRDIMTDTADTIFAVVPASGTTSTGLGASDGISPVTLGVGSGIHFAAGANVTTTLSDAGNGSGVVTIGLTSTRSSLANPNAPMSSFQIGTANSSASGAQGHRHVIYNESGIMLAAGTNMDIDYEARYVDGLGSGIFTFNATLPSGNAITSVSAGGDSGFTWTHSSDIVADGAAETLALVAGTGLRLDTDATNNAVRFSVSGSLPLATHPSTTPASSSDNAANTFIQDITLDAYGHITGIGTNTVPSGNYHPVIDSSSRLDASLIGANGNVSNAEYGYLASVSSDIQAQIDAKGSGTMSRLKIGASDGLPQLQQLGDGSGLFFAAGDNMTITLSNSDAGSGVLTFASTTVAASASGNAFGAISTGSDIGYTWNNASNVTALAGSQALNIIPASGIRIDTDNTNSAIRLGVSGTLPDLESAPSLASIGTITTGVWNGTTIALDQGGTGATSFGNDEVIYKPNGGSTLSSSSRMKFDGQTFTITHTSGPSITLENTNADGAAGIFKFSKDGSSPATNDNIGTIEWSSEDSGSAGTTYAKILGSIADVDAGSEQGALKFFVAELDGTLTEGLNITGIDNDGDITVDVTTHDGANGGLKLGGTLVTATAAELNALDGFTGSSIGSGTMSKFHVGSTTQVDPTQISMGDGSGLFFAAGSNMTITTTNTDGSGIITFASSASGGSGSGTMSKLHVGSTTQVDPNQISLGDGSGLFFAAGDNMTITTTNTDGSGIITFASSASGGSGSGTMSRLKVGASDGLPQLQQLGDGSGLFFVAGDNMSVTLTNNDAGSGILTFASAVSTNNPTFTGNITIGSAEISETELEILDGATLTTTELNYVDGVTSAIQTQLDTKGSGTMSRLKIGASDGLPQLQQLGDGSGIFFAGGDNMTVTLTNSDAGSGILTFASAVSTNNPTFTGNITIGSAEISETELEILDGATLTTTELNYVDGVSSAIQTQLDAKASLAGASFTGEVAIGRLVNPGKEKLQVAGEIATSGIIISGRRTVSGASAPGTPSGVFTVQNHQGLDVVQINSVGVLSASGVSAGPSGLRINGTAVTSTAAELNIMDGGATVTTPTVAGADAFVMNDGGTMAQVDIDNVDTYLAATTKTLTNKTLTSPTITGPTITGTTTLASGVTIGLQANDGLDHYHLEVGGLVKSSGVVTPPITSSDAATVTFDLKQSNFHMHTLARASTTFVFANAHPGHRFLTRLTQDGTGSRNVVFPGGISWARAAGQNTPPPPSPTATHSTMYGFVCTSGVAGVMYYDGFIVGSGIRGGS